MARDQISAGFIGTISIGTVVFFVGLMDIFYTLSGNGRTSFIIAVAGVATAVPLSVANSVWIGLQKSYIAATWNTVQTLLNLVGLLLGILLHTNAPVMVAAFYGSSLLANILSLVHLLLAHPELRPKRIALPSWLWREVLSKGMLFALISISGSLSYTLDNVMTLALIGPLASARIAIALRIAVNAIGIIGALIQPLWPALAEAHGTGDVDWCRRALTWGTAGVVLINIVGSCILITCGEAILKWWLHDALGIDSSLLCAIALWIFGISVPSIIGLFLNATSTLKFQLMVGGITGLLAIGMKFLFATPFGVSGIILAAPISWILITWPAYVWWILKWWKQTKVNVPLEI